MTYHEKLESLIAHVQRGVDMGQMVHEMAEVAYADGDKITCAIYRHYAESLTRQAKMGLRVLETLLEKAK